MNWYKQTPLHLDKNQKNEIWTRENGKEISRFDVDIYLGKKTDMLSQKKNIVETISKQIQSYKNSRTEYFSTQNKEQFHNCPICNAKTNNLKTIVNIYGAEYVQCEECSHAFVREFPKERTVFNYYFSSINFVANNLDKIAIESRLNSIVSPWVDWILNVYKTKYNSTPKRILDVGFNAGFFVEACKRKGIHCDGIDLGKQNCDFSKEIWNTELDSRNFTEVFKEYKDYDVVTFWGLLEHTPNPLELLNSAKEVVKNSPNGMVISKVPRWDSLSTAIQLQSSETVIRHLDPMGHIMMYTDASIAELYHKAGLKPSAAWYYGMDVYETLMQLSNKTLNYETLINSGKIQIELQQSIDEMRFSDGLVFAGTVN